MSEPVESDRPRPWFLRRNTRSWWKRTTTWIMIAAGIAVVGLFLLFLYLYTHRTSDDDEDGRLPSAPAPFAKS